MMRREGLVRREGRLCGGWPTDHMRLLQDQRAFKGGKDVNVANFDNAPGVSEMDALIAYLQVLGTMVDFSTFQPDKSR